MNKKKLELIDIIIAFVDSNFKNGKTGSQARNFRSLIKFMSENDIPFELSSADYELLLGNSKITNMLDSMIKSNNNKMYFENPLFYSLAIIYSNSHGLKIDFEEKNNKGIEKFDNEEFEYDENYFQSDSYKAYLKTLNDDPYTPEEEINAFKRYANGESLVRDDIITHNLRLVVSIAKKYYVPGVELIDLIQEGNLGLYSAIDKYDYTTGNKFSSYATWWIKQAMTRYISNHSRTIRVPVHLYSTIDKVKKYIRKYEMEHDGKTPSNKEISSNTNVPMDKVELVLKIHNPVSLNKTIDAEDKDAEVGDFLEDNTVNDPEDNVFYEGFRKQVFETNILTNRQKIVLIYRYGFDNNGKTRTLDAVGKMLHVTRERIRQIEVKALKKLKNNYMIKQFDGTHNYSSIYFENMRNSKGSRIR